MAKATYIKGLAGGGYDPTLTVATGNEQGIVVWPRARPGRGTKTAVALIHGAGGSAIQGGSGGAWENVGTYLAEQYGFIVVSIDAGSNGAAGSSTNPNTWGNSVAMSALDAFFKWAAQGISSGTSTASAATTLTDTTQSWRVNQWQGHLITAGTSTGIVATNSATVLTLSAAGWTGGTPGATSAYFMNQHFADLAPFGKTTKIILIGASMGGLIARNWASRNPSKVACIVDIAGVIDGQFSYTNGGGTIMDTAFGGAAIAAPTISGTAGAVTYNYKVVAISALGDGPPSPASLNFSGPVRANLGGTPTTVNWVQLAANTSGTPITGYRILRSEAAGAYTEIGTTGLAATFNDNVTGTGSAYTQRGAAGGAYAGSVYEANAVNANPSFDPQAATNLTANLKAIPLQYWWSANDNGTSTGSGVAGTVNTQVQTFANLYGSQLQLQEIPGDPVHNSTINGVANSTTALATLSAFVNANQ